MKKNGFIAECNFYFLRKAFRIMRISVFLLLAAVLQTFANDVYAEKTKLTLDFSQARLVDVLDEIEESSEFYFLYNESLVDTDREVSISIADKKIDKILDELFGETDVVYTITDRKIILAPKSLSESPQQPQSVSGTVRDEEGQALPGVTVIVRGSSLGTITDPNGNFSLNNVPGDAILVFSYVGMIDQEIVVGNQTSINITMEADYLGLEEVIVVGYGTQKKVNLTGAVSVADKELLENRPVGNVQQALQGMVPNLIIAPTAAGGEPGADMAMSIRGLTSFEGSSNPYVLVDGIPMEINDIDPNDIESVSVLKDAASTSIYGARAAYGVILITTKQGRTGANVSYSMNYGWSSPTIWPEIESGSLDWAHALNDAITNAGGSPFYPQEALDRLAQNLENPGSAAPMLPTSDGLNWDIMNTGTKGVANDDLTSLIVNRWAPRAKHNLAISGGNEAINYYISGGYYDESGLLKVGEEYFRRYNVDAKINARVTSWMEVSLLTKYKHGYEDFPWNQFYGRAWVMNWIGKLKPGTPAKYPGTDIWTQQTRAEEWKRVRENNTDNQLVASPRITLEPIKGWVTNFELNYTSNQYENATFVKQYPWVRPSGEVSYEPQSRAQTEYRTRMQTNYYLSPNVYSTYTRDFGQHNLNILAGYQYEVYNYSNLNANAFYLLSDAVPSISTAVGEKTVGDELGHWATQSVFGRFNYNFAEKYLFEVNVRADGSSRFDQDNRWGVFPSFSAGWVISNESFFPAEKVDLLKIRASYGTLGNQNVANYLYIPTLPVSQTNYWLFSDQRAWTVGSPNLTSVNLTWEQVATIDFGLDALFLSNRLGVTFDVYQSRTTSLVGPGEPLPAVLGTSVPKKNEGEIKTNGWELELSWRNSVSKDFSYQIRGVISDYKSTVVSYNNSNKLLNTYYDGQVLGEIWGFETAGYYQSDADIESYGIDQSYVYSGTWYPGDFKYVDQTGDGKIGIGNNTFDDHGDKVVVGNSTPRYVYGLNVSAKWKGLDVAILLQGIAKRDLAFMDGIFRGPAAGPMHNNVLKGQLDYWRDETSPLGANPDAYFPRPYAQYFGQNGKNYSYPTDHLLQNGAFLRLKNVQVGYSLPSNWTRKIFIKNARVYLSGENLLTFTKLMFFDPEAFGGRWYGAGDAYPLSKTISIGLNLNF